MDDLEMFLSHVSVTLNFFLRPFRLPSLKTNMQVHTLGNFLTPVESHKKQPVQYIKMTMNR